MLTFAPVVQFKVFEGPRFFAVVVSGFTVFWPFVSFCVVKQKRLVLLQLFGNYGKQYQTNLFLYYLCELGKTLVWK